MWLLAGAVLSGLHLLSLIALVARLGARESKQLQWKVMLSYLFRYMTLAALLFLALSRGLRAGLSVAAGFWLARWFGVYLCSKHRLDWVGLG